MKKNQRNGAKAEPTVSPVWIMGTLVSKEAGMTKGLTGAAPDALLKKTGKVKGMDSHKMASAAIGYLAGGKTGTCILFWRRGLCDTEWFYWYQTRTVRWVHYG